jgi:hypothetical protein
VPAGWAGSNAWNGYLLTIVGYADAVASSVGTDASGPSGSQSGTIYYWNGAGYSSLSVTDEAVGDLDVSVTPVSLTEDIGGHILTVNVAAVLDGSNAGSTSLTSVASADDATTLEEATAQSVAPTLQISYELLEGATTLADLTITVNLGTLEVNGSYAQAPVEGS